MTQPLDEANTIILRKALRGAVGDPPSAQDLAHGLGYRPARKGILAVTSRCRALERRGFLIRLAPRDQWSVARWFTSDAGGAYLREAFGD